MSRIPTTPSEQRQAEQARRAAADSALAREAHDVQWLLTQAQGRRFLRLILDRSGACRSSFDTNAMAMAFNEGRRSLGVELLRVMQSHCPDLHAQMLDDRNTEARPNN